MIDAKGRSLAFFLAGCFANAFMPNREIAGVGDKTKVTGFIVQGFSLLSHPGFFNPDPWIEDHFLKPAIPVFRFLHHAFC